VQNRFETQTAIRKNENRTLHSLLSIEVMKKDSHCT
jgi:hypothetical protein